MPQESHAGSGGMFSPMQGQVGNGILNIEFKTRLNQYRNMNI